MAGATRTTADAVLKEDYLPSIVEQLNNEIPLLNYAEQNTEDVSGRRAVLPIHVSRNSGVGARAEGGTLPTAGSQGFTEERIPVFYNYGRLKVTGPLIKSMSKDATSFARAVDMETKNLTNDLKRDVNRQAWGDGTGAIANCGLSSNSNVISLSGASTVQVRQLEVNEVVDIGTLASPTSITSAATISGVDVTNKTITLTATTITTSAGNYVFRSGNGGVVGSSQKEITGAALIVDSAGTIFNVNPSTYPVWAATENGNSGTNRQVSETLVAKTLMDIQIAGGLWPDIGFASSGVHLALGNLLTSLKRFPNTRAMKGGYEGVDFQAGGGPVVTITWDRDCPANSLYFFRREFLTHFKMSEWEWMDDDGAVLSRISGEDAYEAVLYLYHELATTKRNAHGKIVDLTEAS